MISRNSKGQFLKGSISPHKGDSSWANSGSFMKGHRQSVEARKKMSLAKKGKKNNVLVLVEYYKTHSVWNKDKKLGPMSEEWRKKISLANKGSNSHLWKGGVTKSNAIIRMNINYRLWREAVFKRDNWTCKVCGIKGGRLEAHHIKPFAINSKSRFDIDNGDTLCKDCHKLTDSYLNIKIRNNYAST
jgi:hypothetical protein